MKTVIEMAREAGGADITCNGWTSWVGTQSTEFLERFAALVREDEREACAKVCESEEFAVWETAERIAAAIRARGETKEHSKWYYDNNRNK